MRSEIFEMIADSVRPISGDIIGSKVGISRVAVNKHIKNLVAGGIDIIGTSKGYRYFPSDTLNVITLEYKLKKAKVNLKPIITICDSTNTYAKSLRESNDFVVVAPYQTDGRGRLSRQFYSNEGGVYMTISRHFEGLLIQDSLNLVLLTGLAVVKTMNSYGISAEIKWPNDVYVGGKKICGILLESTSFECIIDRIYQGIGINVSNTFCDELKGIATNMVDNAPSGAKLFREDIIVDVAAHLQLLVKNYIQRGQASFLAEYTQLSKTIGHIVSVKYNGETITGKATGLSALGYLLLEYGGVNIEIVAGDIM